MGFADYLNNKFLNKNYTVRYITQAYDNENGVSDGKFSKAEVRALVKDAGHRIGTFVLGCDRLTNDIFTELDKDNGSDKYITFDELNVFLKSEYNITINDIMDMKIQDACIFMDKQKEKKQSEN